MSKNTLNTIAGAADVTVSKGVLTITGLPKELKLNLITSASTLLPSLVEQVEILEVSYTAANNTLYKFVVSQIIDGVLVQKNVEFLSDANGTDAEIATALVDSFNAQKGEVKAVASGSGSPITFTADAKFDSDDLIVGESILDITPVSNVTVANNQSNITTALQVGSITNATPRVVTATAHGLSTGSTLTIALATGAGAADVNKTHRVTFLTANTFELDGTSNTGAVVVTAATGIEEAQASRGQSGDLKADGILSTDIASGKSYSQVDFGFGRIATPIMEAKRDISGLESRLYVSAHDTLTPFAVTTNFGAFDTELTGVLDGSGLSVTEVHALV